MVDALLTLIRELFFYAAYVSNNSSFPEPLAPDKEKVAIARMLDGDAKARETLIEFGHRLFVARDPDRLPARDDAQLGEIAHDLVPVPVARAVNLHRVAVDMDDLLYQECKFSFFRACSILAINSFSTSESSSRLFFL